MIDNNTANIILCVISLTLQGRYSVEEAFQRLLGAGMDKLTALEYRHRLAIAVVQIQEAKALHNIGTAGTPNKRNYAQCVFPCAKAKCPYRNEPQAGDGDNESENYGLGEPQAFCYTNSKYADDVKPTQTLGDMVDED